MAALINFSGIASGIDSASLIKALLNRERAARVAPLEDRITSLEERNSVFDELTNLLEKLKSAADGFRSINGSVLAKNATSADETKVTALAENSATNGTYSVTVSQLARNATSSFNDRFSATTSVINSSINNGASSANRTVTVTTGTGTETETVGIVIDNTTTISDFVDDFNAASSKTEASLVNVGTSSSPSYAVVFTSINPGTEKGQLAVSVGSEIQTAGAGAFTASTLNQAQNATLSVSGINGNITRSSNQISDILPGLTLNLVATGSTTVTIGDDPETTLSAVQDFVDAYNEIVKFIKENDLITRQEDGEEVSNVFGPLAEESLDESILSSLREALIDAGQSGGTVNILADLGITTARDGTLDFDQETFKTALVSDPESTREITQTLGENLAAVNGTIAQYTRFGGLIDNTQSLNTQHISDLQDRIEQVELSLIRQEEDLTKRFARLESLIGQLSSQQNTLLALLPG